MSDDSNKNTKFNLKMRDIDENVPSSTKICFFEKKMKRIRLIYGLLSLLTLITGIVIYFLFRDLNNISLFLWIPKPEFIKTMFIRLKPSIFSNILRYNIPDMLWFVSAILFLRFIWFYKINMQKAYILSFYVIGVLFETSQLSKNVPGTFDWMDLLFMGIGAYIEGLLYNSCKKGGFYE